jgi:hypothetical protein
MARMIDRRRALLVAALAAVRVTSREPVLLVVHAWLDSWRGIGSMVVGMARHGYDLSLTSDRDEWRATFLHRSHLTQSWIGQVLTWCTTPWQAVQEAAWRAINAFPVEDCSVVDESPL